MTEQALRHHEFFGSAQLVRDPFRCLHRKDGRLGGETPIDKSYQHMNHSDTLLGFLLTLSPMAGICRTEYTNKYYPKPKHSFVCNFCCEANRKRCEDLQTESERRNEQLRDERPKSFKKKQLFGLEDELSQLGVSSSDGNQSGTRPSPKEVRPTLKEHIGEIEMLRDQELRRSEELHLLKASSTEIPKAKFNPEDSRRLNLPRTKLSKCKRKVLEMGSKVRLLDNSELVVRSENIPQLMEWTSERVMRVIDGFLDKIFGDKEPVHREVHSEDMEDDLVFQVVVV